MVCVSLSNINRRLISTLLILILAYSVAAADVRIRYEKETISFEARETPINEILDVLGTAIDREIIYPKALSKRITGEYHGTVSYILRRLLLGFNYTIKISDRRLVITLLDRARASGSLDGPSLIQPPSDRLNAPGPTAVDNGQVPLTPAPLPDFK